MSDISPYIPPEWAPQSALWIGWPRFAHDWLEGLEEAREETARFIEIAARFVPVSVAGGDEPSLQSAVERGIGEVADLVAVPMSDVWLRDTGPVLGLHGDCSVAQLFGFNGWGGKYGTADDRYTAGAIASQEGFHAHAHEFILEGGSIDVDGEGRLLTTRECLLNPNRNPGWTEEIAECRLKEALGISEIIWIDRGLINDHTDGHIDNIARFISPGHVVCQRASGDNDPQAARLFEIETTLRKSGLKVSTLPSPGHVLDQGAEIVPASHMNFVITNGAIILPIYDEPCGFAAAETLDQLMPHHEIVPLRADHILKGGGGAFHCMSCHVPDIAPTQRSDSLSDLLEGMI